MKKTRFHCDRCDAAMINGVFCHEHGCPNRTARYDRESGAWIKQYECRECGCMVDLGAECCIA